MSTTKAERHGPMLISFSGLDGSGKTTQIENLRNWLRSYGLRVKVLAFWDDVVVAKRYREGFVHKVYKSEQRIGTPGNPVNRRDKNVRAWYLSILRYVLYLMDAINLFQVIAHAALNDSDVIIMDRYIYDELANLPLGNPFTRAFARMVTASVPKPDISYFLDADIEAAYARKPEYPIEFMHRSRRDYLALISLLGGFTVIPPLQLDRAKEAVLHAFTEYNLAGPSSYPTPVGHRVA